MISLDELGHLIEAHGFSGFSVVSAQRLPDAARRLDDWRSAGFMGTMGYLNNPGERDKPDQVMVEAQSIISVAMNYYSRRDDIIPGPSDPFIARYARGRDYHRVMKERLGELAEALTQNSSVGVLWRACVDTAPLLEREYAAKGGLGFIAKSSMLITPGVGSYTLLGELLVDQPLPTTSPVRDRCGSCTNCIVDCPTNAFIAPRQLDARRCISYWTIETRDSIPEPIREKMENMVFGCDRCQEVCPFNGATRPKHVDPGLQPLEKLKSLNLSGLLKITTSDHKRLVKGTALERAARDQLMRNAAVAMGNSKNPEFIEPLGVALRSNRYPVVREHCAWALGRIGGRKAHSELQECLEGADEQDPTVLSALQRALERCAT